jgi:DNA polymerase III delta prime subunit
MYALDEVKQLFETQRQTGRLHHAWILEGIDTSVMAEWLKDAVSQLIGQSLGNDYFHPNVLWLKKETPYTIDNVRTAISFLEKTSWDGGWKICVIEEADRLNLQAQNALLKIIEEPTEYTIIFLTSKRIGMLLPTLYSRALVMTLSNNETSKVSESDVLQKEWIDAVYDILMNQRYEKLFMLQDKLTKEEFDTDTQAALVLQGLKCIIDSYQTDSQVAWLQSLDNWIMRWEGVQKYFAEAIFFNVDQKQFCVKLTTKILE